MRSVLHCRGLRFRKDHRLVAGDLRVRADIVFPRQGVAVFCDGCFWHGCPEHFIPPRANADFWAAKIEANRQRDVRVADTLSRHGWVVLRFWEHTHPDAAADVILNHLRADRTHGPPP